MKLALIDRKLYRVRPEHIPTLILGEHDAYIWHIGDPIDVKFEDGNRLVDPDGPYLLDFPFFLKGRYWSLPVWQDLAWRHTGL